MSFDDGAAASEFPRELTASPQYAIAQLGSCWMTASKTLRASVNQYECSIATPRSNWPCTLESQDVGNATLPSFSGSQKPVRGRATGQSPPTPTAPILTSPP